jgi:hypothetical protein
MSNAANKKPSGAISILSDTEKSILRAIAYFDIFHYPISKEEIRPFLSASPDADLIDEAMEQLVSQGHIFCHHEFYSLHNNSLLAHRRIEGNLRAKKLLKKAFKIGRFLFGFPFVRAVCISGSLSKHFADEHADIDFFIITRANRLWLARTLMHLFKKLTFLTGHQHFFCMNYYIDEENLLIPDQNIFTAIEIASLLPVSRNQTTNRFLEMNHWCLQYLPDLRFEQTNTAMPGQHPIKRFFEWTLDNHFGDRLDHWLLGVTTARWQRKTLKGRLNKNGRTVQLLTGKHFSRSNPGSFQEKVLAAYEEKLIELNLI